MFSVFPNTHTHTLTHIQTFTHTHMRMHTNTHTYTHTRLHTHRGKNGEAAATAASKKPEAKVVGGIDITTKTGGAYIPPAKLRMMQAQITDKSR